MKLLVLLTTLMLPWSASAQSLNSYLQECQGGSIRNYQSVSVSEYQYIPRLDQLFSGGFLVGDDGVSTILTTVDLTVRYRDGRQLTFTRCAMSVTEDYDATFVSVRDCNRNGRVASPSILCHIGDLDGGPVTGARVNDTGRNATGGAAGSSETGSGVDATGL